MRKKPDIHQLGLSTPSVEFPVTICVVAFGPHANLTKRFLESLYRHTPTELFRFAAGGFWAIRTDVLHQLDWPDGRLLQAGDDLLLGEALRQNQLRLGNFTYGVEIHQTPRRNANAPAVSSLEATFNHSRM